MRPGVRTATLDGYLGLARSVGPRSGAASWPRSGLAVADLAVPDKWVPAAAVARVLERSRERIRSSRTSACGWPACAGWRPSARSASCSARSPTCAARCGCCAGTSTATTRRSDSAWRRPATWPRMRLWFEFGEPAPTRQALELATATLLGHRPRAARPAVGAAVDLLHPPGTGVARRPPRGVRAPAAVRARVHRAGLLRRRARRREPGVRPAAPALRRAAPPGTRRPARRDGDRPGDAAGRDAAARSADARPIRWPAAWG